MKEHRPLSGIEAGLVAWIRKIPPVSSLAETRGWGYVLSWCQRLTGLFLVMILWGYVCAVAALKNLPRHSVLTALLWILAFPLAFHAFNGMRIILYECFGNRDDETMIRWVFILSLTYILILGLITVVGQQTVSPFLYWLVVITQALMISYGVLAKLRRNGHAFLWMMQRITVPFLLLTVPAYVLFIQLTASPGIGGHSVIQWGQRGFTTAVYLMILIAALFHGGYGIWSVIRDYFSSRFLNRAAAVLLLLITSIFAWYGLLAALRI